MSQGNRGGFTIIELLLSMTFISVLLLAIALTVIQISNSYNRGLTLKGVNQSGRDISTELSRGISVSSPFSVEAGVDSRFIDRDWGGRLCTGQYSYIWNYGATLNSNNPLDTNQYIEPNNLPAIRFVKVVDPGANYCQQPDLDIDTAEAVELLYASDQDLALHGFDITSESTAINPRTGEQLYSVRFLIGTNRASTLLDDYTDCKEPGQEGADPAYCSIQEFNMVVRAGNLVE